MIHFIAVEENIDLIADEVCLNSSVFLGTYFSINSIGSIFNIAVNISFIISFSGSYESMLLMLYLRLLVFKLLLILPTGKTGLGFKVGSPDISSLVSVVVGSTPNGIVL